jgi:hypothetical protein
MSARIGNTSPAKPDQKLYLVFKVKCNKTITNRFKTSNHGPRVKSAKPPYIVTEANIIAKIGRAKPDKKLQKYFI